MLFGVFGPQWAKESPCGHQLVNSKIFHFCRITTHRYYGSPKDFIIKYHEDGFGDDDDDCGSDDGVDNGDDDDLVKL